MPPLPATLFDVPRNSLDSIWGSKGCLSSASQQMLACLCECPGHAEDVRSTAVAFRRATDVLCKILGGRLIQPISIWQAKHPLYQATSLWRKRCLLIHLPSRRDFPYSVYPKGHLYQSMAGWPARPFPFWAHCCPLIECWGHTFSHLSTRACHLPGTVVYIGAPTG